MRKWIFPAANYCHASGTQFRYRERCAWTGFRFPASGCDQSWLQWPSWVLECFSEWLFQQRLRLRSIYRLMAFVLSTIRRRDTGLLHLGSAATAVRNSSAATGAAPRRNRSENCRAPNARAATRTGAVDLGAARWPRPPGGCFYHQSRSTYLYYAGRHATCISHQRAGQRSDAANERRQRHVCLASRVKRSALQPNAQLFPERKGSGM